MMVMLLTMLKAGGMSTREMGKVLGMNKSRVSSMIGKLERRGIIQVKRERIAYHDGTVGNKINEYRILI